MNRKPNIQKKAPSKTTSKKTTQKPDGTKAGNINNEVEIDARYPIPFEYGGEAFSYIQDQSFTPFLPPKDNFGQNILEARILSNTHNACINTKRDYCAGVGFQDKNGKDLDQSIKDWFESMNLKNQSARDINESIFESDFTFGNTPIELVKLTVGKTKKFFVYPHNFLEWRLGTQNDDGIITSAVQSKLFFKKGFIITKEDIAKAKRLPIYNPLNTEKDNWFEDENGAYRTLIWYKNPFAGFPNYGLPSSIGSYIYQVLEYKGARYNLDEFENNMVVSALLVLAGQLGEEEATRITRKIIKNHTGDGKRGRVIAVASEEGLNSANLLNLNTTKDGSFNESDDRWSQKIILANQWDAVLAGLINPSTLGKGAGFITKILELKYNTVIKPAQNKLMKNVWSHIFKLAQEWLNIPLDQYEIQIQNQLDISGLTDVDITPAVQMNEVREAKGLPADPALKGKYMPGKVANNSKQGGEDVQD